MAQIQAREVDAFEIRSPQVGVLQVQVGKIDQPQIGCA
jgi:hypothetical protein